MTIPIDYLAQYRQAIRDGAHDFARTILTSAIQAARIGGITPAQVAALRSEVEVNPPE